MYSTTTQRSDRLRSWKASKVLWHLPQINPGPKNANHPHTFTSAKPASQIGFHQTHLNEGGAVVKTISLICFTTILRSNPLTISCTLCMIESAIGEKRLPQCKCLPLEPFFWEAFGMIRKFRKSSMSSIKHAVSSSQGGSRTVMKQDELFGV